MPNNNTNNNKPKTKPTRKPKTKLNAITKRWVKGRKLPNFLYRG